MKGYKRRGFGVGNQSLFNEIVTFPFVILGNGQKDILGEVFSFGILQHLLFIYSGVLQNTRGDQFVRIADEQFSCFLVGEEGQAQFFRGAHREDFCV